MYRIIFKQFSKCSKKYLFNYLKMQSFYDNDQNTHKKRKADEITKETENYSSINQSSAEIDHEPKKLRLNEGNLTFYDNTEIKVFPNEDISQKNFAEETQDPIFINEIDSKCEDISKKNDQNSPKTSAKPILFLNKLIHYPKDFFLDNMVSFREMMYPDLLKGDVSYEILSLTNIIGGKPIQSLELAFMTTFGYDIELLEPLLKGGVKVYCK